MNRDELVSLLTNLQESAYDANTFNNEDYHYIQDQDLQDDIAENQIVDTKFPLTEENSPLIENEDANKQKLINDFIEICGTTEEVAKKFLEVSFKIFIYFHFFIFTNLFLLLYRLLIII